MKSNAGAGLFTKDLAVTKGEIIAILRMDNNPAGKWLVQNDQGKSECLLFVCYLSHTTHTCVCVCGVCVHVHTCVCVYVCAFHGFP